MALCWPLQRVNSIPAEQPRALRRSPRQYGFPLRPQRDEALLALPPPHRFHLCTRDQPEPRTGLCVRKKEFGVKSARGCGLGKGLGRARRALGSSAGGRSPRTRIFYHCVLRAMGWRGRDLRRGGHTRGSPGGPFYAMCSIVFCKDNATRVAVVYFKRQKKLKKRKEKLRKGFEKPIQFQTKTTKTIP